MRRGRGIGAAAASALLVLTLMPPAARAGAIADAYCGLGGLMRLRIERGSHPTRSGQITIVPGDGAIVGPGISHDGAWNYLQNVPLFAYGPGFIEDRGRVGGRVRLAAIAPTQAELLGFDHPGEESPLDKALVPEAERPDPPKLIVTLVWDAVGDNVLNAWRSKWPFLRRLTRRGTWFNKAEVGSSPSVTPPAHATIGTGVYPRTHGLTDLEVRDGGRVRGGWSKGPKLLDSDTLADRFDAANGNAPKVGAVVAVPGHLGMIGHGSFHPGGDKDVAIVAKASGSFWGIRGQSAKFFRFPSWVNPLPGLGHQARILDRRDGREDGRWRSNPLSALRGGFDSPARIPQQTKIIRTLVKRQGFGKDDTPDLLAINHKIADHVGHEWHMHAPEMGDTIRYLDRDLKGLIRFLNRQVGRKQWALFLTADHGHTPAGRPTLDSRLIGSAIARRFDDRDATPVVKHVRPSQVFLNQQELKQNGFGLKGVARFLLGLSRSRLGAGGGGKAFAAAVPTRMISKIAC